MRKNQKYGKDQMYLTMEKWQTSGLSQIEFCKREKLATSTFGYWLRKYRKAKGQLKPPPKKPNNTFIPVEVSKTMEAPVLSDGQIQITYPNGLQVSCPVGIAMQQLKTLINI